MRTILPIFLIVIALVIFFVPTRPVLNDINETSTYYAEIDNALNNANAIISARRALEEKYNQFSVADLDKINKLLPNHVDNVRLIIDINNVAAKYGMVLRDISVVAEGSNPERRNNASPSLLSNNFSSMQLSFSVRSNYESLRNFLSDLEKSLRLVDILKISFGAGDEFGVFDYSIKIRTYCLRQH